MAQVTIAGTPDGDGTVTYEHTDADSGTDGHQVNLPTLGGKSIYVVVTHTDSGPCHYHYHYRRYRSIPCW